MQVVNNFEFLSECIKDTVDSASSSLDTENVVGKNNRLRFVSTVINEYKRVIREGKREFRRRRRYVKRIQRLNARNRRKINRILKERSEADNNLKD